MSMNSSFTNENPCRSLDNKVRLIFIGDGEARAELEKESVEGVAFMGQMPHDKVLRRCSEAMAVISPSICWETFGLASVEAMAVGTPSLVGDLGGLPDTVKEGQTGFVFHHGDVTACAEAIRRVLNLDKAAFDRMASAAKERIQEKYTEEANYRQLQSVYGNARQVLLVHNYYGSSSPSGENNVFESEKSMLERHGIVVETFTRQSDEICGKGIVGLVKGALCTVANPFAAYALARKIQEFHPDVVHFHNTFPLISPLAVRAAHQLGCRVVMTLHNYRTLCAAGVPMREGRVCSLCLERRCVCDALRHRCYRGSLFATVPLAINIALYRRLLPRWVDKFIVLSEFQKERMASCGWPCEKLVVKGNFVNVFERPIVPAARRRNEILYVGRLSSEKGVFTLLEAWRKLVETRR